MTPPEATPLASRSLLTAAVAFAFHAPGLWLFFRGRLGSATRWRNAIALAVTLGAMAATFIATRSAIATTAAWLCGHFAWGAWLAVRVWHGRAAS
jgi:hypothetical protein